MQRMKTQPSLTPKSETLTFGFKEKAESLLNKIEDIHSEIQQSKLSKFKDFLYDISRVEEEVEEETKQKKKLYENLLVQIAKLTEDVEEELHESNKINIQVRNRIDLFNKSNEKAFEKLKIQRMETQQRLENYLSQKIKALTKKSSPITIADSLNKTWKIYFKKYKDQLIRIKDEVHQFFQDAQIEEQRAKKEIFGVIQQCAEALKDKQIEGFESEALDYMRIIHLEIEGKINKMTADRLRMEQEVLNLLETVYDAASKKNHF